MAGEGNAKKEMERARENETKIEISMNYIHRNCNIGTIRQVSGLIRQKILNLSIGPSSCLGV